MNELIKIKPRQAGVEECAAVDLITAHLLEKIAELAYKDPEAAHEAFAKLPYNGRLAYLRDSVANLIMDLRQCGKVHESDLQEHFYSNLQAYIPQSKRVQVETVKEHKPDGFVEVNGVVSPVEIKLGSFNNSALKQLQRYMEVYGCTTGIAVAARLTCDLPACVKFIAVNQQGTKEVSK